MKIENNILKHYLKNVLFITGTAYAGKSTAAALLAEQYGLAHCRENYHDSFPAGALSVKKQPNLCYFQTMTGWQEFINRTPEEYERWVRGVEREAAEIEVAELIRLSRDRRVVADTNIPLGLLAELADYNQIAVMLSPREMSVGRFFDRDDADKRFIRERIMESSAPEKTMENFKACLARINSRERYAEYAGSGFFTLVRDGAETDTRLGTRDILADHFGLSGKGGVCLRTERLIIRPFREDDYEQFLTLLDLYPGWAMQRGRERAFFDWHLSNYEKMDIEHGYVCLGVFLKENGILIGNVGLNEHDDLHLPELGYGLLAPYRGKGYAKEAARAALRWAGSAFPIASLVGTADENNLASRRVLEACGFVLEEIKELTVHITDRVGRFAVYRYEF